MSKEWLDAHRRAILAVQGAGAEHAERELGEKLRRDTEGLAIGWAAFFAVIGGMVAIFGAMNGGAAVALGIVIVATALAAAAFSATRVAGRSVRMFDGLLVQKFVTRKKRRPYAVFGRGTFRVGRELHDLLVPGVRYRVRRNAAGAVVLDVPPGRP